jgi:senataxin
MKIMEDGFVDGNGCRYNPSIVRVGVGQSASVRDVCLEEKVDNYLSEAMDITKLANTIEGCKAECRRIHSDIFKLRERMTAMKKATPYPLAKEWEVRIDENHCRVFYVNHKDKMTTFECPPPPEEGQRHFHVTAMPEYNSFLSQVVKLVERYNSLSTMIERYMLCQNLATESKGGKGSHAMNTSTRQNLETHILDSTHIVMTTLGTAGNRALEACNKFEVVIIDEAAQSVEPSTLAGLQLGSSHAILVGDPQQLPATIFSMSGRNTKFDRSLFQRLEEAGHDVHMLNTQYRMHPSISDFPRRVFYDGKLQDGPNVKQPEYGNPLKKAILQRFHSFQPFTVLNLESTEERGGTSLSNTNEAQLALHLFINLKSATEGLSAESRVAVITPYAQQAALLRRTFENSIGVDYERFVEINTVDAFQGREANIVIFSCVRAAGSNGIGFLSDVRRMNVALTRAKYFLFVIARCSSIVVNPYWRDLVEHAREKDAVIEVPFGRHGRSFSFPDLMTLTTTSTDKPAIQSAMDALTSLSKRS